MAEVHIEWDALGTEHIGRPIHLVGESAEHWGLLTRMFRKDGNTTIFIGAGEQKEFGSMFGTTDLYVLKDEPAPPVASSAGEGRRGWSGPASPTP